jgi:molybdopterin converting factor small subunit
MKVKVLFFATLKDRAGTRQAEMDLPDEARVRDLKARLGKEYPGLTQAIETTLVSVNRE